jgi:hypothetical protein
MKDRADLLYAVGQVRKLVHAVVDALLVLVDVGPGVGGRADRRNPPSGWARDDRVRALDLRLDRLQLLRMQNLKHSRNVSQQARVRMLREDLC